MNYVYLFIQNSVLLYLFMLFFHKFFFNCWFTIMILLEDWECEIFGFLSSSDVLVNFIQVYLSISIIFGRNSCIILTVRLCQVTKWPVLTNLTNADTEVLNAALWYNSDSCTFVLQKIPTLDLCRNVGTGVIESDLLNLMLLWNCWCILFNLTWAYFLRSIVHSTVKAYRGTFIWGSICLLYTVNLYWWRWLCICDHIVILPRLIYQMLYVGIHELWFIPLVV